MAVTTDSPRVQAYRRVALELIIADHGQGVGAPCFHATRMGPASWPTSAASMAWRARRTRRRARRSPCWTATRFCATTRTCASAASAAWAPATPPRATTRCARAARNAHDRRGPVRAGLARERLRVVRQLRAGVPHGALVEKRRGAYRSWETERVRTTCPHCGVGCQLDLVVKDGRNVDAEGAPGVARTRGLCVKGRSGSFDFVDAPDRLTAPLVRNAATGELEPASWDDARSTWWARRFTELRDAHGGEALAASPARDPPTRTSTCSRRWRASASTRTMWDCCARLTRPVVAGLATMLGSGDDELPSTTTNPHRRRKADVVMLVGSNP